MAKDFSVGKLGFSVMYEATEDSTSGLTGLLRRPLHAASEGCDMKMGIPYLVLLLLVPGAACASSAAPPSRAGTFAAMGDVSGRWNVTISVDGKTIPGIALLTQSGDRVTGSMGPDEDNQHPLEGIVEGHRIALTMRPRPGRNTAFDKCQLTLDGDTMTGTTEGGPADQATIQLVRQHQ